MPSKKPSSKNRRKPIPGFNGLYFCYRDGSIESSDRWVKNIFAGKIIRKGRILKPGKDKDGYLKVTLVNKDRKRHYLRVSRIVLLTYKGHSDLQVNHKDGNKKNNNISNLEYVTSKQNIQHYLKNGLKVNFKGAIGIKIKLVDKKSNKERVYTSIYGCAKKYNVDPTTLHYHLKKKTSLFLGKYLIKYA